tara:strand:+ start:19 stop:723 length:705 start_codon:yes stop_codon:yes gene_type:complete
MKKSISIIIPLYNEGKGLENILNKINNMINKLFDDYELLIFNDGSKDKTGEIIDKLAKKNSKIRAFHNKKNMNLGYNYRIGIKHATKKYLMLLPGPDSMTMSSIEEFIKHTGEKEVISAYIGNQETRTFIRKSISKSFVIAMNLLFGLKLRHYLSLAIYETKLVKNIKMTTNSFGLAAEILIRSIKMGYSHKEFPIYGNMNDKTTTCFRMKNIVGIGRVVLRLFFEMNFVKNDK